MTTAALAGLLTALRDTLAGATIPRDDQGRWTNESGSLALAKSQAIRAQLPGHRGGGAVTVYVNPTLATLSRTVAAAGTLGANVVAFGEDIAVGQADLLTFADITTILSDAAHSMAASGEIAQYMRVLSVGDGLGVFDLDKAPIDPDDWPGGLTRAITAPIARAQLSGLLTALRDVNYLNGEAKHKALSPEEKQSLAELVTALRDVRYLYSDDQPRAEDGKWTDGGTGSRRDFHVPTSVVGGKLMAADGSPLPAHIQALSIPPAWQSVTYNPDPGAALHVHGRDGKNRPVKIYNPGFVAEKAAAKFDRVVALNKEFEAMKAQNEALRSSISPRIASAADATALIMHTGIRPGSEEDTGAEEQAYGATTLLGHHVVTAEDGSVSLQFVGKKAVSLSIPVSDPSIAAMLTSRAAAAGADGQIFSTSDGALQDHVHTLGSGVFKPKDFRTLVGTRTAMSEVASMPVPTTQGEYRKSVSAVAKVVSAKLGNTPTVALQSYISPHVFNSWRPV